jgi:hypothetical protein
MCCFFATNSCAPGIKETIRSSSCSNRVLSYSPAATRDMNVAGIRCSYKLSKQSRQLDPWILCPHERLAHEEGVNLMVTH